MRRSTLAPLGALLALSACLSTSEPFGPAQNYGFVFIDADFIDETFMTNPNAVFYRASRLQLPSTQGLSEGCAVGPYDSDPGSGESPPNIDGGPHVQIGLSGDTRQLVPQNVGLEGTRYLSEEGAMVYEPGDVATITVPGAEEGFPSWTLNAKTAEEFVPQDIVTPVDPETIQLRWTTATSSGSKMIVSMRYPASTGGGMEQIFCELVDDGAADLEPQLTQGWRAANAHERQVVWTRWRITTDSNAGNALVVISTFQVPFGDQTF